VKHEEKDEYGKGEEKKKKKKKNQIGIITYVNKFLSLIIIGRSLLTNFYWSLIIVRFSLSGSKNEYFIDEIFVITLLAIILFY